MIERLQYINHQNEVLDFGKQGLYVAENDLRNYAWKPQIKNNKISGFKKEITNKTLPIILRTESENAGLLLKNKLFETFEKDVIANKPGRLIIDDYYMSCFVIENGKTDYMVEKNRLKSKVKIITDFPYWIKETTAKFNYSSISTVGTNLDYNRDYPYDYTSTLLSENLINTNFVESNFRIIIYGRCLNPVVTIAGHNYSVKVSLNENEFLTIDSLNKTIIKTYGNGLTENCFNKRDRKSYIFEKIPVGNLNVASSSDFKFDVVLLEERSEPKWV